MTTAITVSRFYTRNLGNFENVKVGYEITSDDKLDDETVEQFKKRLVTKVEGWVREDLAEIDADARRG